MKGKSIEVKEAIKKLKGNFPWKKILIHGEEDYLTEHFLKKLSSVRNVEKFYADEDLNGLFSFTGSSLFGSSPMPVIIHGEALPSVLKRKKERERFLKLLSELEEFVVACFRELDYRELNSEIFSHISSLCDVTIISTPYTENQILALLKRKFESAGKSVSPNVLRLIINTIGTSMRELKVETDKLISYPGELDEKTVKELLFSAGKVDPFSLVVPLIRGEKKIFLSSVNTYLSSGGDPVAAVGLLQSQIRTMIRLASGENVRLPSGVSRTYKLLIKEVGIKKLISLLYLLDEAEFSIKTGARSGEEALKLLAYL